MRDPIAVGAQRGRRVATSADPVADVQAHAHERRVAQLEEARGFGGRLDPGGGVRMEAEPAAELVRLGGERLERVGPASVSGIAQMRGSVGRASGVCVALRRAVGGHHEHLAARVGERAQLRARVCHGGVSGAVLAAREVHVSLRVAQPARLEQRPQRGALRKAAPELEAGEPEPRDLVEDMLGRHGGSEVRQVDVVPHDRHEAKRGARQRRIHRCCSSARPAS